MSEIQGELYEHREAHRTLTFDLCRFAHSIGPGQRVWVIRRPAHNGGGQPCAYGPFTVLDIEGDLIAPCGTVINPRKRGGKYGDGIGEYRIGFLEAIDGRHPEDLLELGPAQRSVAKLWEDFRAAIAFSIPGDDGKEFDWSELFNILCLHGRKVEEEPGPNGERYGSAYDATAMAALKSILATIDHWVVAYRKHGFCGEPLVLDADEDLDDGRKRLIAAVIAGLEWVEARVE